MVDVVVVVVVCVYVMVVRFDEGATDATKTLQTKPIKKVPLRK